MSAIPCPRMLVEVQSAFDYLKFGTPGSEKEEHHKVDGSDRMAAMTCDCGTPEAFVAEAKATAEQHGRRNQALSLIQSHPLDDLDPSKPEDIQRCNDAGYALAKRCWPDAKVLVVTHADSEGSVEEQSKGNGGKLHNHILVLNDDGHGRALRRTHWKMITRENDALMRELDLSVATPAWKREYGRDWLELRGKKSEFDRKLGDRIYATLTDGDVVDEQQFKGILGAMGIEIEEKTHRIHASKDGRTPAHDSVGWTYRMYDDTEGTNNRWRRRAANRLSKEFTRAEVRDVLDLNRQLAAGVEQQPEKEIHHHEHQGPAQSRVGRPAEDHADTRAGRADDSTGSARSAGDAPGALGGDENAALTAAQRFLRERDAKRRRDGRDGRGETGPGAGQGHDPRPVHADRSSFFRGHRPGSSDRGIER